MHAHAPLKPPPPAVSLEPNTGCISRDEEEAETSKSTSAPAGPEAEVLPADPQKASIFEGARARPQVFRCPEEKARKALYHHSSLRDAGTDAEY